jgi:hypothetical protein
MPTTQSITVKRLENLGNYSNKTIEETIILNEGEDADEERKKLLVKIERALHEDHSGLIQAEIDILRGERNLLKDEIQQLREQLKKYKTVLEAHRAFIESAGDILEANFDDDTPTQSDVDLLLDPTNKSDLVIDTYDEDDEDDEDEYY